MDWSELSLDVLIKVSVNSKYKELFWGYDELIELMLSEDFALCRKAITCMTVYMRLLGKKKLEYFEKTYIRWLYLATMFFLNIQCLSEEYRELFEYKQLKKGGKIRFMIPTDDIVDYPSLNDILNQKRHICVEQQTIVLQCDEQLLSSPSVKANVNRILAQYQVTENCILWDQLYVRLLCEQNFQSTQAFQLLSIETYNYLVEFQLQELATISSSTAFDITSRIIDHHDFFLSLIRVVDTLQHHVIPSLHIYFTNPSLFQDYQEKVHYYILSKIQEHFTKPVLSNQLVSLFFAQLQDNSFRNFFKKHFQANLIPYIDQPVIGPKIMNYLTNIVVE